MWEINNTVEVGREREWLPSEPNQTTAEDTEGQTKKEERGARETSDVQGKRERQREKGCRRRSLSTFRIRILRVSFFSGGRVAVIPNPFPFLELYSDPYFSRCFSAPLPCQTPCFILFFFLLMFRPGFLYLVS